MPSASLKCAACDKKVTTDKAVVSENGRVFCCQDHHDWFFAVPDKPPLESRKGAVSYQGAQASIAWSFLVIFLLCLGVLIWDGVGLWLGRPVDVFLFAMMAASTLCMVVFYFFYHRRQRTFKLALEHRSSDMTGRDFAAHLEMLYRKKQLSRRDVLLIARQEASPELAAMARKIRSGEIP